MLDFCASTISSDIEIIPIQKINEAYERMLKDDVKYRFVIDMASWDKARRGHRSATPKGSARAPRAAREPWCYR